MKVPKKNIKSFHDILPPPTKKNNSSSAKLAKIYNFSKPKEHLQVKQKRNLKHKIAIIISIWIFISLIALGALKIMQIKNSVSTAAASSISQLKEAVSNLKSFNTKGAGENFQNINQSLNQISSLLNQPGRDVLENFIPIAKAGFETFGDIQKLDLIAINLNEEITNLSNNLPSILSTNLILNTSSITSTLPLITTATSSLNSNSSSSSLVENLSNIKSNLDQAQLLLSDLSKKSADFNGYSSISLNSILSWQIDLNRYDNFLGALINFLDSPQRNIVIMFQNNSEIRPAGGFLGSYAVASLNYGKIASLDLRDIYDPDGQLFLKTVPPKPLQLITTNWGARDANWFFDFPESASKTIYFLESSKMYSDYGETFDGAIAISPKVFEDLLNLVGPISLPDYNLIINPNNFLTEIQKEVESGKDKKAGKPKTILKEILPILLDRLSKLDNSQKQGLISYAQDWLNKKDMMLYFSDPNLEDFFNYYNLTGQIFSIPAGFSGDYLAVVNANIGAGKIDAYINQNVTLQSQVNLNGTIDDYLKITRQNNGGHTPYWWYNVADRDYLQIFTPPTSNIIFTSGGSSKSIKPPINYLNSGYVTDPDVAKIEATATHFLDFPNIEKLVESGKNVFTTWLSAKPGETENFSIEYQSKILSLSPGDTYQFVFDKQAGDNSSYDFQISAPLGYKWAETNSPIYEYKSDNPNGRVIINLTLQKN